MFLLSGLEPTTPPNTLSPQTITTGNGTSDDSMHYHLQKAGFLKYIVNAHHLYEHVQNGPAIHRFQRSVDVQMETLIF